MTLYTALHVRVLTEGGRTIITYYQLCFVELLVVVGNTHILTVMVTVVNLTSLNRVLCNVAYYFGCRFTAVPEMKLREKKLFVVSGTTIISKIRYKS